MSIKRTSILIVSTLAFAGGVLFASSMDWTDRIFAQSGTPGATAPRPRSDEVRTIAEASNAFVSISEYITPAVVSIQAERVARRGTPPRRGQVPPGFEDFFRQFENQPPQQAPSQQSSGSGFIVSRDGYQQPQRGDPEARQVVELAGQPVEVPDPVPVPVGERAHVDLVDDRVLVPERLAFDVAASDAPRPDTPLDLPQVDLPRTRLPLGHSYPLPRWMNG
jgi:hypothetical protein